RQVGEGKEVINFLAIGESTIAGVGAKSHAEAMTGQFAKHLSRQTDKTVRWHALGVSGITIRRTINELVPKIPQVQMDIILVALGGNDVFGLATPKKFRADLAELLKLLRHAHPKAKIYVANVPMVGDFLALPNPTRYVLSRLAKMQHFNAKDLISQQKDVYYYEPNGKLMPEHFSDGIHPSALGYDFWAEEMVRFFLNQKKER
ncbi:MAG: SGNH/GDSL hydrolase family protein, partial [Blastocatellia bacterium]|nr:SGNH/GDSL hydrolase family protein [Blastocatellia bacterium]